MGAYRSHAFIWTTRLLLLCLSPSLVFAASQGYNPKKVVLKPLPKPEAENLLKKKARILPASCSGLRDGIVEHCCGAFSTTGKKSKKSGKEVGGLTGISNVTVTDCLGQSYHVPCVDRHGEQQNGVKPGDEGKVRERTRVISETPISGPSDPVCIDYQEEFARRDCQTGMSEIVCPGETTGTRTTVMMPTCQEVEQRRLNCPLFPEIEPEEIDTTISLEPETVAATPFDTDSNPETVYGGTIPSVFENIPTEDRHRVLDTLRFEFPANSLRYWVARSDFRSVIERLPEMAVAGGAVEGAFLCDANQLSCEIRPLGIINLDAIIGASLSEQETDTEYRDELREFVLEGFSYSEDWIDIEWTGWISVRSFGDWGFNLSQEARFNFLPTHVPESDYETDTDRSAIETTRMINGLPSSVCTEALALEENGLYYGYKKPFFATCNDLLMQDENYDVMDEYPRPVDPLPLAIRVEKATEAGGAPTVYETRCLDEPWSAVGPRNSVILGDNVVLTVPASRVTGSLSPAEFATLRDRIGSFGCAGQEYKFRTDLPNLASVAVESGMSELAITLDHYVVSAAGYDFAATLKLGGFESEIHPGLLNIRLHILVEIAEWVEENVWGGWLLGWFLRWVEVILSAMVTIIANGLNILVLWSLPSGYSIEANDVTANVHGVIRQIPYTDEATTEEAEQEGVAMGTRRLVTTAPSVTRPTLSYDWNFDECYEGFTTEGDDRFIDALLEAAGGCLFGAAASTIRYATSAIIYLFIEFADWLFDFTGAIRDAINQTLISEVDQIQDENDFAGLIQKSIEKSYYNSQYLTTEELTPDSEALINRLPFPYQQICTVSGPGSGACEILELTMGGRLKSRFDISRLGAKTHYRSYRDFADYLDSGGGFDFNFPPVRFCVGGDNPPSDEAVYPFTKEEIDSFSNFVEIRVDEPGNWHNQCAYFIDVKPASCLMVDNPLPGSSEDFFNVFFAPTLQTVLLVNEIFFCPENSWCDILGSPIKNRAKAATCSLLADIWFRHADLETALSTATEYNLLQFLINEDPQAMEALERTGYSVEEQERFLGFARSCQTPFLAAGGIIPERPERNTCALEETSE